MDRPGAVGCHVRGDRRTVAVHEGDQGAEDRRRVSLATNTVELPRWKDVPLRDVRFDDLQVWITGLSVDGSVRFEGKGCPRRGCDRRTSWSGRC